MSKAKRARDVPTLIVEASAAITLAAGVAVLVRIATVARGNVDLAFAIAQVANFWQVLLSTFLLAAPLLGLIATLLVTARTVPVIAAWLQLPRLSTAPRMLLAVAALGFTWAAASIFQTDWIMFSGLVLLFALAVALWPWFRRHAATALRGLRKESRELPKRTRVERALQNIGTVLVTLGLIALGGMGSATLLGAMMRPDVAWASTEVLYFSDRDPYLGRVIASDEVWTHIIYDEPRQLLIVPTESLLRRTVCDLDADGLEARLWTANLIEQVSLRTVSCETTLDEYQRLYDSR